MSETTTPRCPDCGTERPGRYCPDCGQKDQPLRQTTGQFLRQAFNEYFGIDGRLWQSLRLLLFRPGALTVEYLQGRRSRYLAPLRLYLSATLLFFFLLSVLDPVGAIERRVGGGLADSTITAAERIVDLRAAIQGELDSVVEAEEEVLVAEARLDSLLGIARRDSLAGSVDSTGILSDVRRGRNRLSNRESGVESARRNAEADIERLEWQIGILNTFPPDSTIRPSDLVEASAYIFPESSGIDVNVNIPDAVQSTALRRLLEARTGSQRRQAIADLGRSALRRAPPMLFLMLPVFALMLKLIYIRGNWFYSEHLIFALHNHAFAFLAYAVMVALIGFSGGSAWSDTVSNLILLATLVYFFAAQKKVYGQGWIKTTVKFLFVLSNYTFIALSLLFLGIVLLAATLG
ncbi:MAG: DUF3667 domain-containing protein [Rhodothermales bacterium]|nr:DUF3667 domain-containing protein [Rhodothermales bacterium]